METGIQRIQIPSKGQVLNSAYTVASGHMRFQFYSESIVRIEFSPSLSFRDDPTSVIVQRSAIRDRTRVDEMRGDDGLVLSTPKMTIRCADADSHPSRETLTIQWLDAGTPWRFGDPDEGNLGGTLKSLDHAGAGQLPAVANGAVSRNHFFVIDDSASPARDPDTDLLRPQTEHEYADVYFVVYKSYTEALSALAALTGRVPMIPKYALGLWFSRYYPYRAQDHLDIVRKFEKLGVPLDVMVLDVDWHTRGWEGYDWNTDLIPDPRALLDWFHKRGIRVGLNVHPGGLPAQDSHAPAARQALGIEGDGPVRFDLADPDQARVYFDMLHKPLADLGVDIWWIDGWASDMPGLDSQLWTNRAYYLFTERNFAARPMILSRYGGFGSQKYPIGFSGDAKSDWSMLAYEVRFTALASNALMPYWSHDIGGFSGNHIDTQMYIRWVQFGAVSPTLRLHSDHGDRAPWEYAPEAMDAFKKACDLRLALVPYLYSLCYHAHAHMISPVRPMYYHWPDDEDCYNQGGQYMLGDAILACPVTFPASEGRAHVEVYLPEGIWFDFHESRRIDGGRTITYSCPIDRIPLFVRAGAVLPTQPGAKSAARVCPDPLEIRVYPGADGQFEYYEDDGESRLYRRGTLCHKWHVHQDLRGHDRVRAPARGRWLRRPREPAQAHRPDAWDHQTGGSEARFRLDPVRLQPRHPRGTGRNRGRPRVGFRGAAFRRGGACARG